MSWNDERRAKIPEYKEQICQMLAAGMYISEISAALGVEPSTMRQWEKADPEFREKMQDARSAHTDTLEKEAVRRARDGVEEVVISQGRVVMVANPDDPDGPMLPLKRRNYSDTLMMFLLKGQRREIYGEKVELDNQHSFNLEGTKERLAAKLAGLAKRVAAPGTDPERGDG